MTTQPSLPAADTAGMLTCPVLTALWLRGLARRPVELELMRAAFQLLDLWRVRERA